MEPQINPNRVMDSLTRRHLSLDLVEIYAQLRREAAVNVEPPPILEVPAISTRAEISRSIAHGLVNDTTPVHLATKEEKFEGRRHKENLIKATKNLHSATREPQDWKENTKPILVDPNVPKPSVPERASSESRSRIQRFAREAKQNGTLDLDPYPTILTAKPFESYLPTVMAGVALETIDADPSLDAAFCKIPIIRCLWDTGAHHTIVSEDLLPKSFLQILREPEYIEKYGSEGSAFAQVGIDIQFSNSTAIFESVCVVRPPEKLPNGFSGIILGQHAMLDTIEYHIVPRKIMESQGINIQDEWGQIRLLGHIAQGDYVRL